MTVHRPNPETDPFRPPAIPTEVFCIHCQQEYESYLMEWRERLADNGKRDGFWCCPTQGCGGKGFGFDIFPIDPDYRDENGEPVGPFGGEDEADDDGEGGDLADWLGEENDDGGPWMGEPIDADALLDEEQEHDASPPADADGDNLPPPPINLNDPPRRAPRQPRWDDDISR